MNLFRYLLAIFIVAIFLFPSYGVSATRYNVSDEDWKYGSDDVEYYGRVWDYYDDGEECVDETYKDTIFMDSTVGLAIRDFEISSSPEKNTGTTYWLGHSPWTSYTPNYYHGSHFYQTWSDYTANIGGYTYHVLAVFTSNHALQAGAWSIDILYSTGGAGTKYWRFTTYIKPEVYSHTNQKVEIYDIINQDPADTWDNVYAELTVGDKNSRDASYTDGTEAYGFIRVNAPSSNYDMLIANSYGTSDNWHWSIQKDETHYWDLEPYEYNTGENPYNNGHVGIYVQSLNLEDNCVSAGTCTKIYGRLYNY